MYGEWIAWNGGKQPVADDTLVDVRYADGEITYAVRADDFRDTFDNDYDWWQHRDKDGWQDCYVAAYKLA